MENNFDNIPENTDVNSRGEQNAGGSHEQADANMLYTDPNSVPHMQNQDGYQNTNYQQGQDGYQNTNYQQSQNGYQNTNYHQQYQDNYNYNVGNNTGYAQEYSQEADSSPISLGEWILILLLMSIPCVNIVLCIIWGFGKQGNITKRNFCRAQLIFVAIGIVLSLIMVFVTMAIIGAGSYGYYFY